MVLLLSSWWWSRVGVLGLTAPQMTLLKKRGQSDKKASSNSTRLHRTRPMSMQNQARLSSGVYTSFTFFPGEWSTVPFSKIKRYCNLWPIFFLIENDHCCCSLWPGECSPHKLIIFRVDLLNLMFLGNPGTQTVMVWFTASESRSLQYKKMYELVCLVSFHSNLSDQY